MSVCQTRTMLTYLETTTTGTLLAVHHASNAAKLGSILTSRTMICFASCARVSSEEVSTATPVANALHNTRPAYVPLQHLRDAVDLIGEPVAETQRPM